LKCDKPQQRKDIAQQLQVHSALFQGDPKELRQIERITATVDFKVTSYWRNKPPRWDLFEKRSAKYRARRSPTPSKAVKPNRREISPQLEATGSERLWSVASPRSFPFDGARL